MTFPITGGAAHHAQIAGNQKSIQNSVREKGEVEREIDRLNEQVMNVQGRLVELANRIGSVLASEQDAAKVAGSLRPPLHSPLGSTISQIGDRLSMVNDHLSDLMDRIKL